MVGTCSSLSLVLYGIYSQLYWGASKKRWFSPPRHPVKTGLKAHIAQGWGMRASPGQSGSAVPRQGSGVVVSASQGCAVAPGSVGMKNNCRAGCAGLAARTRHTRLGTALCLTTLSTLLTLPGTFWGLWHCIAAIAPGGVSNVKCGALSNPDFCLSAQDKVGLGFFLN